MIEMPHGAELSFLWGSKRMLSCRALDMLENELATICLGGDEVPQVYRKHWQEDLQKLRVLLERECAAQVGPGCELPVVIIIM